MKSCAERQHSDGDVGEIAQFDQVAQLICHHGGTADWTMKYCLVED